MRQIFLHITLKTCQLTTPGVPRLFPPKAGDEVPEGLSLVLLPGSSRRQEGEDGGKHSRGGNGSGEEAHDGDGDGQEEDAVVVVVVAAAADADADAAAAPDRGRRRGPVHDVFDGGEQRVLQER